MRADRLFSIVLLLQRHHRLRAKVLADRLDVTERTIYRDIEALSIAGVPVYTRTGPDGGCFLDESYRTSLNWFTGAELQTLLYTTSASPLSELGIQSAVDSAILKLLAMLPNYHHQQVQQMSQRLYLDPSGWYDAPEDNPLLPFIKDAVWGDKMIDVAYETWEGEIKQIRLHPYSLVYKSGRWYLVACKAVDNKMRTYRVTRLKDIQPLSTSFERRQDFNIADYWNASSTQFLQRLPTYPVTLRVRGEGLTYFQHMYSERYEVIEEQEDWKIMQVQYTVFEEARTSVLGLGIDAEVIKPQELHDAVIQQAQAIIKKHHHNVES